MLYYIRKISGVIPPVPAQMKMIQSDIDLDSERTADGTLHRNKVAVKMKFEVEFPRMNKTSMTALLALINHDSFQVEYEDMFTGAIKTGTFYSSADKTVDIWKIRGTTNSDVWFKEFKVSLIEY